MDSRLRLEPRQTILFIGDSITDAGRREPTYAPLGRGYVHFAAHWLWARYPHLELNIRNSGISGDTTRTLKFRWERDCLAHKPDILSILIGINDVWCQHDQPNLVRRAVFMEEFEANYTGILKVTQNAFPCQIVLIEPFMFCNNPSCPMFKTLHAYIEIVNDLSHRFDTLLIPMQDRIDKAILQTPPNRWSQDMVHPYSWAHAWLALEWLDALIANKPF
ncbi:MAG: SGNH/GDSL hydrolase family protein [Sedimentisphaerales bacterium]|nr:SGNH/GDSL hydrolase family protein [Sedimentisphaerales bacterium]